MAEEDPRAAQFAERHAQPEDAHIPTGYEFIWQGFWALDPDRHWSTQGFGSAMGSTIIEPIPRRIPFTAIDRYARRFCYEDELFEDFLWYINQLDREYLQIMAEQSKDRWSRASRG